MEIARERDDEKEASGGEKRGLGADYKKGKVAGKSKRNMIGVANLFKWSVLASTLSRADKIHMDFRNRYYKEKTVRKRRKNSGRTKCDF